MFPAAVLPPCLYKVGTDTPAVASRTVFPPRKHFGVQTFHSGPLLVRGCLFVGKSMSSKARPLMSQLTARSITCTTVGHSTIRQLWTRWVAVSLCLREQMWFCHAAVHLQPYFPRNPITYLLALKACVSRMLSLTILVHCIMLSSRQLTDVRWHLTANLGALATRRRRRLLYTVSQKNRTPATFCNNSNSPGSIAIDFDKNNR